MVIIKKKIVKGCEKLQAPLTGKHKQNELLENVNNLQML